MLEFWTNKYNNSWKEAIEVKMKGADNVMVRVICEEYDNDLAELAKKELPDVDVVCNELHGLDGTEISLIISAATFTLKLAEFIINHFVPRRFTIVINKKKYAFDSRMDKAHVEQLLKIIMEKEK